MDQKTTVDTITVSFFDQDGHKWELVYNLTASLDTLDQDLARIKDALKTMPGERDIELMASL